MGLPANLLSEAKVLGSIISKARSSKKLTKTESAVVDRYQAELDLEASQTWAGNQIDLARELGVVRETISRHMKDEACPGRESKGYCVEKWREYLRPEVDSLADYDVDFNISGTNSAELHQLMLVKSRVLYEKLELAEKKGDKSAIEVFEKRWLNVSKSAKDYENLIQKHDLEIGETIRVSEMEEVEFLVILAMMDTANRFIDEFAIVAATCSGEREIRQKADSVFEEIAKSTFRKAFTAKKVDERVISLWERAIGDSEKKKKPAPKKKRPRKK